MATKILTFTHNTPSGNVDEEVEFSWSPVGDGATATSTRQVGSTGGGESAPNEVTYNIGAITDASISGHTITLVGVGPSGQTVDTKFRTGAPGCS